MFVARVNRITMSAEIHVPGCPELELRPFAYSVTEVEAESAQHAAAQIDVNYETQLVRFLKTRIHACAEG